MQFGVCCKRIRVASEQFTLRDGIELVEPGHCSAAYGDGERTIHADDGRWGRFAERIVQGDYLLPVGRCVARRLRVAGGDAGLDV